MYCPCRESMWKRFIEYVLIEGLSAKTGFQINPCNDGCNTGLNATTNSETGTLISDFAFTVACSLTRPKIDENGESDKIDLFTDTAAILNLSNLGSIMGFPLGTRSVFTCAFRVKREVQCIFLGKMAIIITSKHGTLQFFLGKLKEKLSRKARVNTGRVYRIVLMLLGNPIIFLKSNKFNKASVSVKRLLVRREIWVGWVWSSGWTLNLLKWLLGSNLSQFYDRNMMVKIVPAEYMRKMFC